MQDEDKKISDRLQGRLDHNPTASLIAELWCLRRSAHDSLKSEGYDIVILNQDEAGMVSCIVQNHIAEVGSIYNDPARSEQENRLRSKLGIIHD